MKQKKLEFDWDALTKREPDIDKACINVANVILSVSEKCIPKREVTIRCNDKIWFDSNIRREIRKRDRFRRKYLKLKTALSQTIFKQQQIRSTRREPPTHWQATGKLDHLQLRVECTLFVIYKAGSEPMPYCLYVCMSC